MLPRQRRKEKAGAGAPLGLGEPRDKPLTRRGLRKRARRGESRGRGPIQAPGSVDEPASLLGLLCLCPKWHWN